MEIVRNIAVALGLMSPPAEVPVQAPSRIVTQCTTGDNQPNIRGNRGQVIIGGRTHTGDTPASECPPRQAVPVPNVPVPDVSQSFRGNSGVLGCLDTRNGRQCTTPGNLLIDEGKIHLVQPDGTIQRLMPDANGVISHRGITYRP